VELSWDRDDPKRKKVLKRLTKEDIREDNLRTYLASDEEDGPSGNADKYRQLLFGADGDAEANDDANGNLEVTFSSAFEDLGKNLKKKLDDKDSVLAGEETTWEKYLREAKEKKRQKKLAKADGKNSGEGNDEDDTAGGDADDPFFASIEDDEFEQGVEKDEIGGRVDKKKQKEKEEKKREKAEQRKQEEKEKAGLKLLMMDDEDSFVSAKDRLRKEIEREEEDQVCCVPEQIIFYI
jgi:hypothetical protein